MGFLQTGVKPGASGLLNKHCCDNLGKGGGDGLTKSIWFCVLIMHSLMLLRPFKYIFGGRAKSVSIKSGCFATKKSCIRETLNLLACGFMCQVSRVRCHMSGVMCRVSRVTCCMSLTPTATATDPTSANSPSLHSRMLLLIFT